METFRVVKFDSLERRDIERALAGITLILPADEGREDNALTRFLNRNRNREEAYSHEYLTRIDAALLELMGEIEPQADPQWWRDRGSAILSGEDAVLGLARERQLQWERLRDLRDGLIADALAVATPEPAVSGVPA